MILFLKIYHYWNIFFEKVGKRKKKREELNDFPLLLFDEENCFSANLETPSLKKNLLKNFFDQ